MLNTNDRANVAALYTRLTSSQAFASSVMEELKAAIEVADIERITHWCEIAEIQIQKIRDIYIYVNEKMCKRVWQQWYAETDGNGWCVSKDGKNFIIYDADEFYDENTSSPIVLARYYRTDRGDFIRART